MQLTLKIAHFAFKEKTNFLKHNFLLPINSFKTWLFVFFLLQEHGWPLSRILINLWHCSMNKMFESFPLLLMATLQKFMCHCYPSIKYWRNVRMIKEFNIKHKKLFQYSIILIGWDSDFQQRTWKNKAVKAAKSVSKKYN